MTLPARVVSVILVEVSLAVPAAVGGAVRSCRTAVSCREFLAVRNIADEMTRGASHQGLVRIRGNEFLALLRGRAIGLSFRQRRFVE